VACKPTSLAHLSAVSPVLVVCRTPCWLTMPEEHERHIPLLANPQPPPTGPETFEEKFKRKFKEQPLVPIGASPALTAARPR
jgi:hypothetical protein